MTDLPDTLQNVKIKIGWFEASASGRLGIVALLLILSGLGTAWGLGWF